MPFNIASFNLFVLLNMVGAEAADDLAGGPLGGNSIVRGIPGLPMFGEPDLGALVGGLALR